MKFTPLNIAGAYLIDLELRGDERGFFGRLYCNNEIRAEGLDFQISQVNTSASRQRGTLRGLHFQCPPKSEIKMVKCIKGIIWDVIVDLRPTSATFRKWCGVELSQNNRSMMYAPKGTAHGFVSLCDEVEIVYFVSTPYSPEHEGIIRWDDPFFAIEWPTRPTVLSEKDRGASDWSTAHSNIFASEN